MKSKPFDRKWLRDRRKAWRCPLAPRRWWPFHAWGTSFAVAVPGPEGGPERTLRARRCKRCKACAALEKS